MATLSPEYLPSSIRSDPRRKAEVRIYDTLRDQLPDRVEVYYSFPWLDDSPVGQPKSGEADFVIIDPDRGILLLEVKGGGVAYDSATGQWSSTDRHGKLHTIKDPVSQLQASRSAIIRKLQQRFRGEMPWIGIGLAVAFPDVRIQNTHDLRADLPRRVVIDREDLSTIQAKIDDLYAYWGAQDVAPLDPLHLQLCRRLLSSSFELHVPLATDLDAEIKQIIELTEQ